MKFWEAERDSKKKSWGVGFEHGMLSKWVVDRIRLSCPALTIRDDSSD